MNLFIFVFSALNSPFNTGDTFLCAHYPFKTVFIIVYEIRVAITVNEGVLLRLLMFGFNIPKINHGSIVVGHRAGPPR
jgi:hypothetical protein